MEPKLMLLHESSLIPNFSVRPLDMQVPTNARRSVVFIGILHDDRFVPKATGFLVYTYEYGQNFQFPYLITAEHVVSGLLTNNHDIYCRVNLSAGGVMVCKLSGTWWHHPDVSTSNTDVALIGFDVDRHLLDHDYIPIPKDNSHQWKPTFGLGDEIFLIGLFKSHHGRERNIPIVRLGTIAAMPEEPIFTKYCGFMDAYLVEVRSIAGLSGSPVFLNVQALSADPNDHPNSMYELDVDIKNPAMAMMNPRSAQLVTKRKSGRKRDPEELHWFRYRFLGLVHGHFDVQNLHEDMVVDDVTGGGINSGIGVVVPANKIIETLYQPDILSERKSNLEKIRNLSPVIPDNDG